jgi:hypothetical protein
MPRSFKRERQQDLLNRLNSFQGAPGDPDDRVVLYSQLSETAKRLLRHYPSGPTFRTQNRLSYVFDKIERRQKIARNRWLGKRGPRTQIPPIRDVKFYGSYKKFY